MSKLQLLPLAGKQLVLAEQNAGPKISLESKAEDIMTDFRKKDPVVIHQHESVDIALARMLATHVRSLLVVDSTNKMIGILTSREVNSSRAMEYAAKHNIKKRSEVEAENIMIPNEKIHAICYDELQSKNPTIRDILEHLRTLHERHVLVVEQQSGESFTIRGMISASDIARSLEIELDLALEDTSFSKIGRYLT